MKFWESDFSCEQILSLPFVFFCFFFFSPLLTSKSHYSTSLIQFAVRSFASLNIAFAIAFMSTWGFRRCVFFFSQAELLYMLYCAPCGAVLQSASCLCWSISRGNNHLQILRAEQIFFLLGIVRMNPAESLVWESIAVAYPGKSELFSDQLRSYLRHSRSQMSF